MKNHSKRKRHYSHQCGRQFVNKFNGLRYYPTFDTEFNLNGENAKVDASINLGTYPMADLIDASHLEKLKVELEESRKVSINTTQVSVVQETPEPIQEQKPMRFSFWKWLGLTAGAGISVAALIKVFKKSA